MSWQGIEGHDDAIELFRRSLKRGRLASTFLFVGPQGVGKHRFAVKLAQALLCQESPVERLDPCGRCPACQQVLAGTHPDLLRISKPKDRSEIPVALLIGPLERRMQEGLCHDISLKPFMGGRRIAIIDDADYLNEEGANCLLKTLEEPPPRSVLILIGTTPEQQLPTIRSRAQLIRFQPLSVEILERLMLSEGIVATAEEARRLAPFCEGSLSRARELADPDLWGFRRQLLAALSQPRPETLRLAKAVTTFVDEAGKEASARRSRSRQIINFSAEFYRQLARSLASASEPSDADVQSAVEAARRAGKIDTETAAALVTRCLDALEQVDRNANQSALLECWIDDLAQLASGKPLLVG
jgi:DNA polymerase-3 subunit delta'